MNRRIPIVAFTLFLALTFSLLGTVPVFAIITTASFAPKVDFAAGTSARGVAISDIDGDGKLDVAVTNFAADTISVLRNTGSSGTISFATKVDLATGTFPRNVAISDIDGDGKPDLVVTNGGSGTISVLLNTSTSGTISFALKVDFTTGAGPYGVAIRDLDGDGKPDLAVTNLSATTVSILRNTSTSGMVSFDAPVNLTSGASPRLVTINDLDGDGKHDVVVANFISNSVSIFRNTSTSGTISFDAKVDFTTGDSPYAVAIGDLDGDSKPDLAVANFGSASASILRNTSTSGSISFDTKVDFAVVSQSRGIAVSDLDGDGKIDLAVTNDINNTASVLRNTSTSGSISFDTKVDFATGAGAYGIAIGDLDGGGKPDLAVANFGDSSVSILRNISDATTPSVTNQSLQATYTGTGPTSFTVTFSENVNNAGGGSLIDDVTNVNNYKIINKGTDGTLETTACNVSLNGDDSLVLPSSVIYAPNTAIVNLGSALPIGSYRLFVCGTTSITDLVGNPLNGGTDFTFDFIVGSSPFTATFGDVPVDYWAWQYIEAIYGAGITGGCSTAPMNYCPTDTVTRAQMAIFLLRGIHGRGYIPPAATGAVFGDVPADHWAAKWIEQLSAEGITSGCGNGNYCPDAVITRAEMSIFLLRAKYGKDYVPPAASGAIFADVPADHWAGGWIEQLSHDNIAKGCGNSSFCPDGNVTRDQMAVFLQKTFNLPLP